MKMGDTHFMAMIHEDATAEEAWDIYQSNSAS
jgi:hypothetical protein